MRSKKQTRKLIERYFLAWEEVLGFGNQKITIKVVDSWEGELDCDAICDTKWWYMESVLTFNISHMRRQSEHQIETTVVHELMHIFLNEMREEGIKHEEHVATQLQKAFMWVKHA